MLHHRTTPLRPLALMRSKLPLLQHPFILLMRRTQFFLALAVYCTLLLTPANELPGIDLHDKALHCLGNFLFFCSLWLAFNRPKHNWPLLIITISFSILMEYLQSLGSREASLHDVLANSSGAFLAWALCSAIDYWLNNFLHKTDKSASPN